MKLTNQHIKQLYKFTREHYVKHYDVQTELVDHLANDIEQIWKKIPTLSFEKARDISFKKFGVFGFMDILEEKQKQLSKKYYKIILTFVKEWFSLPKIILTFSIFLFFYMLLTSNISSKYFFGVWIIYIAYTSIKMYSLNKEIKIRKKKTNMLWLLEDFIYKQGATNATIMPIYTFQLFVNIGEIVNFQWYSALLLASLSTIMIIVGHISLNVLPKKTEKLLEDHYPEYNLV